MTPFKSFLLSLLIVPPARSPLIIPFSLLTSWPIHFSSISKSYLFTSVRNPLPLIPLLLLPPPHSCQRMKYSLVSGTEIYDFSFIHLRRRIQADQGLSGWREEGSEEGQLLGSQVTVTSHIQFFEIPSIKQTLNLSRIFVNVPTYIM